MRGRLLLLLAVAVAAAVLLLSRHHAYAHAQPLPPLPTLPWVPGLRVGALAAGGPLPEPENLCGAEQTSFLHSSCDEVEEKASLVDLPAEDRVLLRALTPLCAMPSIRPAIEARVPCVFANTYSAIYDGGGWADEAWVSYVPAGPPAVASSAEVLIRSAHALSARPIIVLCLSSAACIWPSADFPRLLVVRIEQAPALAVHPQIALKWLALLLARVRTGVLLEPSSLLLAHADILFSRTNLHVTRAHPYPLLPLPQAAGPQPAGAGAANGTVARPLARPAWTFHALPCIGGFFARLARSAVHLAPGPSEEDYLFGYFEEQRVTTHGCPWTVTEELASRYLLSSGPGTVASLAHPLAALVVQHLTPSRAVELLARMLQVLQQRAVAPFYWQGRWSNSPDTNEATPLCLP